MIVYDYYVFRRAPGSEQEIYWSGRITAAGAPGQSTTTEKAAQFDSAAQAYEAAGRIDALSWWRVGKRPLFTFERREKVYL